MVDERKPRAKHSPEQILDKQIRSLEVAIAGIQDVDHTNLFMPVSNRLKEYGDLRAEGDVDPALLRSILRRFTEGIEVAFTHIYHAGGHRDLLDYRKHLRDPEYIRTMRPRGKYGEDLVGLTQMILVNRRTAYQEEATEVCRSVAIDEIEIGADSKGRVLSRKTDESMKDMGADDESLRGTTYTDEEMGYWKTFIDNFYTAVGLQEELFRREGEIRQIEETVAGIKMDMPTGNPGKYRLVLQRIQRQEKAAAKLREDLAEFNAEKYVPEFAKATKESYDAALKFAKAAVRLSDDMDGLFPKAASLPAATEASS